jgi:polygalacturonase
MMREPTIRSNQRTIRATRPFTHALGLTYLVLTSALGPQSDAVGDDITPTQPKIPDREYSLKDFGAVPDGKTSNSDAFRRAIVAVQNGGGGILVVPPGEYFTGPIDMCSTLNLHLERGARLVFSDSLSDYPKNGDEMHSLIAARNCHDVAISGEGTIDGNGSGWWERVRIARARDPIKHEDAAPRPHLIVFDHCQRARLSGVTLTRSPMFHFVPAFCEEVAVEGITIVASHDSPNTDGIDPSQTRRMLIAHCQIDTGDDCIAFKAGGMSGPFVEDVLVTDCTFKRGHGCSVGSSTRSGLRRITVRRCLFEGTDVGVRLKSNRLRGGICEDVTFTDLVMKNVGMPILIYSYYPFPLGAGLPKPPELGKHVTAAPVTTNTPIWRRLTVRNLTATGTTGSAGMILGLPEMPVTELLLENISVEGGTGLRIGYARNVTLRHVRLRPSKGPPFLIEDTVEGLQQLE